MSTPNDTEIRHDVETNWPGLQSWSAEQGPCKRHSQRILKKMIGELHPQQVLEIGCGDGTNLAFLETLFPDAKLNGVDISTEQITRAQARFPTAKFTQVEARFKGSGKSYDLVAAFDLLEHIDDDRGLLEQAFKMTSPNGHFITHTLQGKMRRYEERLGHVRNYSPGSLKQLCESVGFEVIEERSWGFPWFSPLYRNALDRRTVHMQTLGEPSFFAQALGQILYGLYFTNSSTRGDYIFIHAKKPG